MIRRQLKGVNPRVAAAYDVAAIQRHGSRYEIVVN